MAADLVHPDEAADLEAVDLVDSAEAVLAGAVRPDHSKIFCIYSNKGELVVWPGKKFHH